MIYGRLIRGRDIAGDLMSELNEKTTVPLRVVIVALGLCASAVWFTATVKNDIAALQKEVVALTAAISAVQPSDRWTVTDQRAWAAKLADSNPSLKVPVAERVGR